MWNLYGSQVVWVLGRAAPQIDVCLLLPQWVGVLGSNTLIGLSSGRNDAVCLEYVCGCLYNLSFTCVSLEAKLRVHWVVITLHQHHADILKASLFRSQRFCFEQTCKL